MKKRVLILILPILALILELLPYGAVLNFGEQLEDGTVTTVRNTFSYFDPITFGYANFGPMLTAVLTCVITLLALLYFLTKHKTVHTILRICCIIALVTSIMPMMYGMNYLSVVGLLITAALLFEAILLNQVNE